MKQDFENQAHSVMKNIIYPLMVFREGLPSEGYIVEGLKNSFSSVYAQGRREGLETASKIAKEYLGKDYPECAADILEGIAKLKEEK